MSYALIDVSTNEVLQSFDLLPVAVKWPNGDISHCPVEGDERGGARLVAASGLASTATSVGIVYGAASGIVRRIIVPTSEAELDDQSHVGDGEAIIKVSAPGIMRRDGYPDLTAAHAHVMAVIGKQPLNARCAVVDAKGNVVGTVMADPEFDTIPDHTLSAEAGLSLSDGALVTREATVK